MGDAKSRLTSLVGGIWAGLIVIWIGISFYLKMIEVLDWGMWGTYFVLGLAGLFLLQGIVWLFIPRMRRAFIGMLIPALILGVVGLIPLLGNGWDAWEQWWPLIIVAVGLVIISSTLWSLTRKRHKPEE